MKRIVLIASLAFALLSQYVMAEKPLATINTDLGPISIELYPKQAPVTVENFVRYANDGFYNGTIFHRVIPGFVIQGGGMTFDFVKKETRAPIKNESNNGLKNKRWTLSMARLPHPDSATSQFFINLQNNKFLDYQNDQSGYAVFAKLTDGYEVIHDITQAPQGKLRPEAPDVAIRILSVKLNSAAKALISQEAQ